jgi:hypothetical protein
MNPHLFEDFLYCEYFLAFQICLFTILELFFNNYIMTLTVSDDQGFIQNEINIVIQDQGLHAELSAALDILTQESRERVAGILRKKE